MPILLTWPNCSSQASSALKPAASAGNDSVPTNLPSGSSAATTWVSTPPVMPGRASTMVIAVPTFLNVDGDGTAVPDRGDGWFDLLVASRTNHPPLGRDVPFSMCCLEELGRRRPKTPHDSKSDQISQCSRSY